MNRRNEFDVRLACGHVVVNECAPGTRPPRHRRVCVRCMEVRKVISVRKRQGGQHA